MKDYLVLGLTSSSILPLSELPRAPHAHEPIEISTIELNSILSFDDSHTAMTPFGLVSVNIIKKCFKSFIALNLIY